MSISGHLGPEIEVVFLMKGQVLQRLREHRKVPGWRSEDRDPITKELRKLLSRLNETSGGSLKIGEVSGSVWSILKFLKMMFLTWRLLGWYVSVKGILSSVLGSVGFRAVSLSML